MINKIVNGHNLFNNITDDMIEWKQNIKDINNIRSKLVYPSELSRIDYFMTAPVALFNGKTVIAKSRMSGDLQEIIDNFCIENFILYCIFKTDNMYICRGSYQIGDYYV